MNKTAIGVAFVIAVTGGVMLFNGGSSTFEKELGIETSAIKLSREVSLGGYGLISTEELKNSLASEEELLIIDTMPYEASYRKHHIPGAKQFLFPIPEMKKWNTQETDGKDIAAYRALLGNDLDKKIVIYCGFVKCTRSHNGALWAVKLGYTHVLRHPGGLFAWKGAGYEVEKETE